MNADPLHPGGVCTPTPLSRGEAAALQPPLAWLQRTGDARLLPVCAHCAAPLGDADFSLRLLCGLAERAELAGSHAACEHGCGELFCAPACRDAAAAAGHGLLCTGRLESEEEPLYRFKAECCAAGEPGCAWLLAARLLLAACLGAAGAEALHLALRDAPPWWDAASLPPLSAPDNEPLLRLQLRQETEEVWQLLCAGLARAAAARWPAAGEAAAARTAAAALAEGAFSLPRFGAAITLAALRSVEVSRRTPLRAALQAGRWNEARLEEAARALAARRAGEAELAEEADEEDEEEEEDEDDLALDEAPTAMPARLAPPFRATAVFPALLRLRHSCAPSALLTFDDPGHIPGADAQPLALALRAACACGGGDELTICWIDEGTAAPPQRAEALRALRLPPCACDLCAGEGGAEAAAAAARAEAAAARGAHAAAAAGWRRALAAAAGDGDLVGRAWDGLGTALLEMGRWPEAAAAFAAGASAAPGYAPLALAAATAAAYPPAPAPGLAGLAGLAGLERLRLPGGAAAARLAALRPRDCRAVIAEAEARAAGSGGWGTRRHVTVPTTDVPLLALPAALRLFNDAMRDAVAPAAATAFPRRLAAASGGGRARLRVHDAFVVRYEAEGGQAWLPPHRDQGMLSLTLALNEPPEFEGGGTAFEGEGGGEGLCVGLGAGQALLFPSQAMHGGAAITRGRRYIIAAFLWLDDAT